MHTRLDEGVSKWIRLHKNGEIGASTLKIIIDARFCTMPDDEVEAVIRDRMEFWESEHFDEAILIRHDGNISEIKNRRFQTPDKSTGGEPPKRHHLNMLRPDAEVAKSR